MRRYFRLACLLLPIAVPKALPASAAQQPFSVTLEAPNKPLKADAELRLRVTVKNISNHDIAFLRSVAHGVSAHEGLRYKIHVLNSKAQPVPPSPRALALRNSKKPVVIFVENHALTLKPAESFVDEINVTELYDLSQPGIYTIGVTRRMPPKLTSHGVKWPPGSVRSNTITVTVVK
jgi:hypothetical protein